MLAGSHRNAWPDETGTGGRTNRNTQTMTITADTASERAFLPKTELMRNKLLLADAGYVDFNYFSQLSEHGGSFIVRGGKTLIQ